MYIIPYSSIKTFSCCLFIHSSFTILFEFPSIYLFSIEVYILNNIMLIVFCAIGTLHQSKGATIICMFFLKFNFKPSQSTLIMELYNESWVQWDIQGEAELGRTDSDSVLQYCTVRGRTECHRGWTGVQTMSLGKCRMHCCCIPRDFDQLNQHQSDAMNPGSNDGYFTVAADLWVSSTVSPLTFAL